MSTDSPTQPKTKADLPDNNVTSVKLSLEEVVTSLTEITKEVFPLVEQANNLAAAVEKQNQFLETWLDFLKEGGAKLPPTENTD